MRLPAAAIAVIALLIAHPVPSIAGDLCRWIDDAGRVNFGDVVPARYKESAKCTGPVKSSDVPAKASAAAKPAAQNKRPPAVADEPAAAPEKKDDKAKDDRKDDCATLFQRYRASQECFERYRQRNASVKVEAYEKCDPLPDPSPQCGPQKGY